MRTHNWIIIDQLVSQVVQENSSSREPYVGKRPIPCHVLAG